MQKENNGRKAALQLSSKTDAVTFFGVFGGRKTFLLRYRNSDKYCMIEGDKCVVNGTKRFSLTEDQAARFRAAEGNFLRELDDATMGKGGFGDIDASGYLDRLYVAAAHIGRGVGSAICDALEAAVKGKIVTHASVTAKPFFEKRGYAVVREQQVERGGVLLTNFVMEKKK